MVVIDGLDEDSDVSVVCRARSFSLSLIVEAAKELLDDTAVTDDIELLAPVDDVEDDSSSMLARETGQK